MPFHERAPTHSNCTLRVDCSCSRRRLLLTAPQSPPLPYLTKKRRNTLDNTVYFVNYVACIRNHDYFFKVMFNALTSHTHTQTAIWRWCTRIDGGGVLLVCIPCFCSFVCTLHIERILFIGAKASNYQLIQWIYFCCCCFVRVVYRFFNNASGSIALSMIHFDTMTTTTESIWRRDCNRHNGQTLKKKTFPFVHYIVVCASVARAAAQWGACQMPFYGHPCRQPLATAHIHREKYKCVLMYGICVWCMVCNTCKCSSMAPTMSFHSWTTFFQGQIRMHVPARHRLYVAVVLYFMVFVVVVAVVAMPGCSPMVRECISRARVNGGGRMCPTLYAFLALAQRAYIFEYGTYWCGLHGRAHWQWWGWPIRWWWRRGDDAIASRWRFYCTTPCHTQVCRIYRPLLPRFGWCAILLRWQDDCLTPQHTVNFCKIAHTKLYAAKWYSAMHSENYQNCHFDIW